ncbi:membrane protein [Cryobacterium sp. MLB-32]|uniref:DUF1269 domain-containing protein n=1 Tax=Cryobacterium sp. MLB-32 TaxID=1529318 RepID=UPI0004E6B306|nr:DUF1269 domain-containing protein [Cryobacterium sp. MLB-32]KFF61026.1 membrane protein [Cryobacterium sp. MLB-32]
MSKEPVFLFLGVYNDPEIAFDDLEIVHDLHSAKVIGTYDAGVAIKEADGTISLTRASSKHSAWTGVAAGAVVGILFPPSIIGMAAVGGATGGIIGHFTKALSRSDLKELGEVLDSGQAALIVIGRDKLGAELDKAGLRAQKRAEKEIEVDAGELDAQLSTAASELDTQ